MKLTNSNGEKTQKLKLYQNSKAQIVEKKHKTSNCDKTQIMKNSNCEKKKNSRTQNVTNLENFNFDKNSKNSNSDITQISNCVKNSICDKTLIKMKFTNSTGDKNQ